MTRLHGEQLPLFDLDVYSCDVNLSLPIAGGDFLPSAFRGQVLTDQYWELAQQPDPKFWDLTFTARLTWRGEFEVTRRRFGKLWIYLKIYDGNDELAWADTLDDVHDKYLAGFEFQDICKRLEHKLFFAPEKSAPETFTQWVESYSVRSPNNKYWYYRYCYMKDRKITHCHLPGGNIKSTKAIALKDKVEAAIGRGDSPNQIKSIINKKI